MPKSLGGRLQCAQHVDYDERSSTIKAAGMLLFLLAADENQVLSNGISEPLPIEY